MPVRRTNHPDKLHVAKLSPEAHQCFNELIEILSQECHRDVRQSEIVSLAIIHLRQHIAKVVRELRKQPIRQLTYAENFSYETKTGS